MEMVASSLSDDEDAASVDKWRWFSALWQIAAERLEAQCVTSKHLGTRKYWCC